MSPVIDLLRRACAGDLEHTLPSLVDALVGCGGDAVRAALSDLDPQRPPPPLDGAYAETLATPVLCALARCDRDDVDLRRLERLCGLVPLARAADCEARLPTLAASLAAMAPHRRAPLLATLYRAMSLVDLSHAKRALEPVMVATPHPDVTAAFVDRTRELRAQWEFARRWPDALFGAGHEVASLAAMKPGDHPVMQALTQGLDDYARAADGAGLRDDGATVRRHLEALRLRRRAPRG